MCIAGETRPEEERELGLHMAELYAYLVGVIVGVGRADGDTMGWV